MIIDDQGSIAAHRGRVDASLSASAIGIVVIGRNEGDRLIRCLESVGGNSRPLVYVDSASTDGSPLQAAALGAEVVQLDLDRPFTAARARNEGCARLLERWPDVAYIQFVDGDCIVDGEWIEAATAFLEIHRQVAAVCGRRRERYPERSVYNLLCDIEWNTPIGETKACGGDVLMRREAFVEVGGFRDDLIAGEEPELCVRLRAAGWRIWRLDREMTLHDAALTRFGQWWKRSVRAGHAFAEGAHLHGAPPERHWIRESRSALLWGAALPLAVIFAAMAWTPWALLASSIYPLQIARLYARTPGAPTVRRARAFFLVLGKFPEALGQLRFFMGRWRGVRGRLIEYK